MNPRVFLIRLLPGLLLRNLVPGRLAPAVADAFEIPEPRLRGLRSRDKLRRFALFTREAAEQALARENEAEAVGTRLFHNARSLGEDLRRRLKPASSREEAALCRALYAGLGIQAEMDEAGVLVIGECFFSRFYTPRVCRLISNLDKGAAAGLTGGGELTFQTRLTEGAPCCRARLEFRGRRP